MGGQGRRNAIRLPPFLALPALAAVLLLNGCGSDGGKTDSAAGSQRTPQGDFLGVIQATDGTLTPHGEGFTLTLRRVAPQVAVFSDRPERQAGAISSSSYLDTWATDFRGDPPNAALAVLNGAPRADTIVLTLQPPQRRGSSVSFLARPVNSTSENLQQFKAQADRSVPQRFGDASLFVDSGGLMQLVAYGSQDVYVTGGNPPTRSSCIDQCIASCTENHSENEQEYRQCVAECPQECPPPGAGARPQPSSDLRQP